MSREVCFSPELKRFCLIAAAPARLQPAESLFNIWNYQIGNNALIRFLPQRLNRNWVKQGNIGGASTLPNWKANEKHFNICNLSELGVEFSVKKFTFFVCWLIHFMTVHIGWSITERDTYFIWPTWKEIPKMLQLQTFLVMWKLFLLWEK